MSRYLVSFLLSLYSLSLFGQTGNDLPTFKEIVQKFFSNYSADELEYPHIFFEKRSDGWFVATKKMVGHSLEYDQRVIFYSYSGKKFIDLDFPKPKNEVINVLQYIDFDDIPWFGLYPYYGYNGWYKDVIKKLESEKEHTDTSLYLLGRAYGIFATSLLSDQFGFSLPEENFHVPLRLNSLSTSQIEKYEKLSKKSIDLARQLKDRYPSFEPLVGTAAPIRYANQVMSRFQAFLTYSPEYAKKIILPDNLYPDSIIEQTKTMMNQCEKGAIFISLSDNDFFPFLYIQQHDKYRRDLYLLNYNLLGLSHEVFSYTHPLFDAEGIKISVDTSFYQAGINDYVHLTKSARNLPFDSVIIMLKNKEDSVILTCPTNVFSIKSGPETKNGNVSFGKMVNVEIDGADMTKNQWILLDIINHLNGRQLVFASKLIDELKSLNSYLECNYIVCKYGNY